MKRRSSYKTTFMDRHGADAQHTFRAIGLAILTFGFTSLMFGTLGSQMLGLSGWRLTLFTLGAAFTLSVVAAVGALRMGTAAGKASQVIYMGGSSTPYQDQFSQEQALVMREDYAGALALYEEKITAFPGNARVRIAAADLYAGNGGNAIRAAELYREVQRLPNVAPGEDIYVSNKLADLYLGPLEEPARALVEFRRLMHRYPTSRAAKHAKMAIDNLKPDLVKRADSTE